MNKLRFAALIVVVPTLSFSLGAVAKAEVTRAQFVEEFDDEHSFLVRDDAGKDCPMQLEITGRVLIDGVESRLSDLNEGDNLTITWEERDGVKVATMVECKRD